MHLAQLKMLLKDRQTPARLFLSYLPYGRQDKEISNNATFAQYALLKLFMALDFEEVICLDPHSSFMQERLVGFTPTYPIDQLARVMEITKTDVVCYPDRGAREKYSRVYESLIKNFIYGEKVRDQSTGFIKNYELITNGVDLNNKNVLIVTIFVMAALP